MISDFKIQIFGPIRNFWGYDTSLFVVDDVIIAQVDTPYKKRIHRYFIDEDSLVEYINLINEDRRF